MKKHLYKIAWAISAALLLAFVVMLIIDGCTYNDMLTSAPFYACVIIRFFEFLLPAQILFGIGFYLKRSGNKGGIMKKIKKLSSIGLATLLTLCISISFIGCDKTEILPGGNYVIVFENNTFQRVDEDVRDTYGWVIDGDTAELWTSSVCEYKAKIVKKDGQILFDGYKWRNLVDILFGDTEKEGSNRDYTVVYDETAGTITLTPKLPQENVEYVFDGITFEKSKGLTLDDLSNYIPFTQASIKVGDIKTVKDFEKLLLNNLDTYKLVVTTENGYEYVYLTPKYHSITVKTDALLLTMKEGEEYIQEEVSCWSTTNGNIWSYVTDDLSFYWDSASTFSYRISFPMKEITDHFTVVYNYRIK